MQSSLFQYSSAFSAVYKILPVNQARKQNEANVLLYPSFCQVAPKPKPKL